MRVTIKTSDLERNNGRPNVSIDMHVCVGGFTTDDPRLAAISCLREAMENLGLFEVLSVDRDEVRQSFDQEDDPDPTDEQCDEIASSAADWLTRRTDQLNVYDVIGEAASQIEFDEPA